MAKKKAQDTKKAQSVIITVAVVLISLAILGASVISMSIQLLSGWVVKVNGEKATTKEFNFYLYNQRNYFETIAGADIWGFATDDGTSYADSAKSSALNSLISTKISKQKAKEMNITMSGEDNEKVETEFQAYKEGYGNELFKKLNVSDDILRQIMGEYVIAEKLYNEITKDFEVIEADFETYFTDYIEANRNALTKITADYIVAGTAEDAAAAHKALTDGEDYQAIAKQYSTDYTEDTEYGNVQVSTLLFPQDVVDAAYELTAGEISEAIEADSKFYILVIKDIEEPNEEELKVTQRETYITQQKQAIYNEEFQTWSDTANIEVNSTLYSSIDITTIGGEIPTPAPETTDEAAATDEVSEDEAAE